MTDPSGLAPGPNAAWWTGLLDPGESLIWTGAPVGPPPRSLAEWGTTIFGLFFAGFAFFWIMAAGFPFGLFGLLHFSAGIFVAFGMRHLLVRRFARARYALTDRRALLAVGTRITSWPITPAMSIEVEASAPGSILFESEAPNPRRQIVRALRGFEQISDAQPVYRRIRALQTGASA